MTKFKDIIITSAGQNALNLAVTAGHKITYTKASLASDDLASKSISDVQAITTLNSVKNSDLARLGSSNGSTVLSATFDNSGLTNDMKFNSVGWYAKTGDAEFLFAVSRYDQEQVLGALEPGKENITQSITLQIALAVSQGTVNVTQTQAGVAMKSDLNTAVDNLSNSINQLSNAKADKDTVTADLAKKADQASVDASVKSINDALATKANSSDVSQELSTKANQSDLDKTNAEVAKKADTEAVNASLALKDDTADVDKKISNVSSSVSALSDTVTANKKATDTALDTKADKTTVNQELATKANSTDVDKKLDKKADTSDVDAKIKVVTDLTNTKANTVDVDSKIKTVTDLANTKANSADVYTKTETDNQINKFDLSKVKFRKQFLNGDGDKVDKTWSATKNDDGTYTIDLYNDDWTASKLAGVLAQLPNKVDTSTVNAQIADTKNAIKSNTDKLQSAINTKANASDVYTKKQVDDAFSSRDATIATKADKATVDAEIAKIDFTPYAKSADVAKDLQGYTTTADLTKLLAGKRDIADSYSRDELDKKFLQLSTDTSGKVSADQIAKLLASKVDKTDLTSQLQAITDSIGTKANSANVTAELAKKDNTADVDAKIKTVTDLANTKANSSDVYTKSAIDTAFSQRDSRITNVTNLANQIDSTRLPLYQGSANEDLKGFFTPQIRMYNNATGVKNIPADCQYQSNFYGTLVVLPDGASNTNDGSQILITPERKAWIAQSNGQGAKSWSDWSRFTLDSDLTALQNSLQSKIDTKANSSDVYTKSDVDYRTCGTIITDYDIASLTPTKENIHYINRRLVDQNVLPKFAEQINQLKGRRNVDGADFNNLTDSGVYYISSPKANSPVGHWGTLIVSNGNDHRLSQLYYADDNTPPWYRTKAEGNWLGWQQLSTKSDVQNAVNLANSASSKVDTVLDNSYVRKQGMNQNGDLVEIKHTGIKQANGGYAFDMWSDDWTASKLNNVIKHQLPSKANTTDVNNALNGKANAGDVSALQGKVNVDTDLFRMISSANNWGDIFGKTGKFNALTSLRINPNNSGLVNSSYSAGIGFGGDDIKGVLSVDYSNHDAVIAGGNDSGNWSEHVAWQSNITNLQNQINSKANASDLASKANASDLAGYAKSTDVASKAQITDLQNQISELKDSSFEVQTFKDEASGKAWEAQKAGHRLAIIQS